MSGRAAGRGGQSQSPGWTTCSGSKPQGEGEGRGEHWAGSLGPDTTPNSQCDPGQVCPSPGPHSHLH